MNGTIPAILAVLTMPRQMDRHIESRKEQLTVGVFVHETRWAVILRVLLIAIMSSSCRFCFTTHIVEVRLAPTVIASRALPQSAGTPS